MESTLPYTDTPCYKKWESILTDAGYRLAYAYDINRFYVAEERDYLNKRFITVEELKNLYDIFVVSMRPINIS